MKYSPREFLLHHKLDAKLHCHAPFGSYYEVHNDLDHTNTMQCRTHPAICLGPTGNLQGTYKFLSLDTGKCILRRNFTELPLTDSIQKLVDRMAQAENWPDGLLFANRHGNEFHFTNDDLDEPLVSTPAPFPDLPAEMLGVLSSSLNETTPLTPEPHVTWQDLAMAAADNAGIEVTPQAAVSSSPEIITIGDDDNPGVPVLPDYPVAAVKLEPSASEIEPSASDIPEDYNHSNTVLPDTDPPPVSPHLTPTLRRSGCQRAPPTCLNAFHLYTAIADQTNDTPKYVNAAGATIDRALPEHQIAIVCHHLFVHAVETNAPTNGKQLGLKRASKLLVPAVPMPYSKR